MQYHNTQSVVLVNGKCSEAFLIKRRCGRVAPCLLFSMCSLWIPCFISLGMREQIRATWSPLRRLSLGEGRRLRRGHHCLCVSPPGHKCGREVRKGSRSQDKFHKSEGLKMRAWRSDVPLPGPFRWSDEPVCTIELDWWEVKSKVETLVGTWLRSCLSLKGGTEVCAVCLHLSPDSLPIVWTSHASASAATIPLQIALERSKADVPLTGLLSMSLQRGPVIKRAIVSLKDWLSLRRDTVWGRKVKEDFPRLKFNPKLVGCCRIRSGATFAREWRKTLHSFSGSNDVSRSRKDQYREHVVRSSWRTPTSRSPGGLHGTLYLFTVGFSKRVLQTCQIAFAAAVAQKKQLWIPYTTASRSVRFGVMSESG